MNRTTLLYAIALAAGAFLLQWLENQYALRLFSTEIYILLLVSLFTFLGIWIGRRLSATPDPTSFARNDTVIKTLGLTAKELEVLALLADGGTNQEMARRLHISTSTIKTHLVHLYQKLEVARRTQAISKARSLRIIP